MSFIFLKCIDTYIYDVSIAFSLTHDEYSLSHCVFENAFRAEHAPDLSIITSRRGSATGCTISEHLSLFTLRLMHISKQCYSTLIYLAPYTVSTSDATVVVSHRAASIVDSITDYNGFNAVFCHAACVRCRHVALSPLTRDCFKISLCLHSDWCPLPYRKCCHFHCACPRRQFTSQI